MDRDQIIYICYLNLFCYGKFIITRFTIDFFTGISARVGKEICFPENEFEEGLTA